MAERIAMLAVVGATLSAALPAGVEIRLSSGRVDVEADAAPLQEILDTLGSHIGMKVEYEGPPPRQLLSLVLHDRTPIEAVLGVLDGQNVDYALQTDRVGTGVRVLLVTSGSEPTNRRPSPPVREPPPPPEPPFALPPDGQSIEESVEEPTAEVAPTPPPDFPPVPEPRPGRPSPGPLVLPSPLMFPTPTPTP